MEQREPDIQEAASEPKLPAEENLARAIRDRFAPLGGVELKLPPRGPMREPPRFD